METKFYDKPRIFNWQNQDLKDMGKISLNANEMVSFITPDDKEFDFMAKTWGFYATPSINSRLKKEGFKTALVVNGSNQIYVMAVNIDKLDEFNTYLEQNKEHKIICWLDEFFHQHIQKDMNETN